MRLPLRYVQLAWPQPNSQLLTQALNILQSNACLKSCEREKELRKKN